MALIPADYKEGIVKTATETFTSTSSGNIALPDNRAILNASSGNSIVFFVRVNADSASTHDVLSYMMNAGTVQKIPNNTSYSITYRYIEIE